MSRTALDPCIFFNKREWKLVGLIGTLVEDTFSDDTDLFAEEKKKLISISSKAQEF